MNKFIPMLIILLILGCSYGKEASRGVGGEIGDSFKKADDKENLLESREKVIRSRNKYNSCIKDRPSGCESEKEEYDQNVAEYVEFQKHLSDL
jgi:hypothetical protein